MDFFLGVQLHFTIDQKLKENKNEEIAIWVDMADIGLFGGDYNSVFGGTASMGL
ncbi:hypothetical protein JQM64_00465 [Fournierella massiliensis]|nr:hypothetical protein [Fournierella massiliensis]MCF2556023.1 hypothetical protein [Fournierella massiliensis]